MQTSTHPEILKYPMAFSDTLIHHGAWLLLHKYVSESTDVTIEVHKLPQALSLYEVHVIVTPKNGQSITFIEHTTDSLFNFPSDELITKLMLVG